MMKKGLTILLVGCLLVAALTGCGAKQEAVQPTAAPEATAAPTAEVIIPKVETPIVRLDSIDYQPTADGGEGTFLVQVTHLTFNPDPDGELDTDYILEEGDTEKLPLAKDAIIDFPMADDFAQTVSVTAGELTEEFTAFVEKNDDKPLFTVTMSGNEVSRLTHFYLP